MTSARRLQETTTDELERTGGHWESSAAGRAYVAAVEAERDALRELSNARATDYTDFIMKAAILIDCTHGVNGKNLLVNRLWG